MKLVLTLALSAFACRAATEADLRRALEGKTGSIELPAGTIEISRELTLASGAHDLTITGSGTTLKASAAFRGRALLVITGGLNIHLHNFSLDGNRDEIGRLTPTVPSTAMMSRFVANNGILAENLNQLEISQVKALHIAGFAILVNASRGVNLHDLDISESGGYNLERHNSGMGGVLLEEGVSEFSITRSLFGKIRGSAIVTRSLRASPLNTKGRIAENEFAVVARDALSFSAASGLLVENNRGRLIGYPVDETDVSGNILPSAVHTLERVEKSTFRGNSFDNIDGRCFTLTALLSSEVSVNTCSEELFGAMTLEGSRNRVLGNHLLRLNLAHKDAPETLSAGIWLGPTAQANRVEDNDLAGFGMSRHCVVAAAPGNQISKNDCLDESAVAALRPATPH